MKIAMQRLQRIASDIERSSYLTILWTFQIFPTLLNRVGVMVVRKVSVRCAFAALRFGIIFWVGFFGFMVFTKLWAWLRTLGKISVRSFLGSQG